MSARARVQRASDWDNARWCQLPPAAATDLRIQLVHFRLLAYLGRVGKANGWCEFSQKAAAELFNCSRKAINEAVRDLVEWDYLLKRGQDETKSAICQYKVLLERDGDDEDVSPTGYTPPSDVSPPEVTDVSRTGDTRVTIKGTHLEPRTENSEDKPPSPLAGGTLPAVIQGDLLLETPKRETRASRLPSDFAVPDEWREWAAEAAPKFSAMIDHEAAKFVDHWHGNGSRKIDWAATWRNWWRRSVERAPRQFGLMPTARDRHAEEVRKAREIAARVEGAYR